MQRVRITDWRMSPKWWRLCWRLQFELCCVKSERIKLLYGVYSVFLSCVHPELWKLNLYKDFMHTLYIQHGAQWPRGKQTGCCRLVWPIRDMCPILGRMLYAPQSSNTNSVISVMRSNFKYSVTAYSFWTTFCPLSYIKLKLWVCMYIQVVQNKTEPKLRNTWKKQHHNTTEC
jgi:hypothetical protein